MRKSLITLVAAGALALSACSDVGTSLAVVNGSEISLDDMIALDAAYEEIDALEEATFLEDLRIAILLRAIETSASDEYGVSVSEAEIDEEILTADSQNLALSGRFTDEEIRELAGSAVVRNKVSDRLIADQGAVARLWDEAPQVFSTACVRHVVTPTEAEAEAAATRIREGEAFSAVADDVSLDTSAAGGLIVDQATGSCSRALGDLPTSFAYQAAIAPVGKSYGPFETEFGWHVILVEDRIGPTSVDDVLADQARYLNASVATAMTNLWVARVFEEADVEVDPLIGTWSAEGTSIIPPSNG